MRRVIIVWVLLSALSIVAGPSASAGGVSPGKLTSAGWDCPLVLGAVHCAPPGGLDRVGTGEAETMSFLVFSETGAFLGTEVIVRDDIFNGQPCPTDPPSGQYTYLNQPDLLPGVDYWACHRYDSPF